MGTLRIDSISIKFDKEILSNVSYSFKSGKMYLIQGQSGIGKSSLLNVMGLLQRPTTGQVFSDDVNLWELSDKSRADFRLANFGFIFQDHNLINGLTLGDNLSVPLLKSDVPADEQRNLVLKTLGDLDLNDRSNISAPQLSGGEDQRGAIGRALITGAKVIFADEPSNSLDHDKAVQLYEELSHLAHDLNKIVIVVSHEELPKNYADVVLTILDQHLIEQHQSVEPEQSVSHPDQNISQVKPDFSSIITSKEALHYNKINSKAKKQLPWPVLIVVTLLLSISGVILTIPQVLAQQQEVTLSKATDNSIFVTNDTLGSNSNQDLEPFRNLSNQEESIIGKVKGVKIVYKYFNFVSYGLTKDNAKDPEPTSIPINIGNKKYSIAKTFSIQPLYPEDISRKYFFSQGTPKVNKDGLVVSQTFLDNNHISSKGLVGHNISLTIYVPYAEFLATSELPSNNKKTVATDGNIYVPVKLTTKITGILADNYPYNRSELGNGLFMDYAQMTGILQDTIKKNPLKGQIFPSFKQQAFGFSALVVQAKTFNDTMAIGNSIKGISPSLHVTSIAQNIAALNQSIQDSQHSSTNFAILIIIATTVVLMITFFFTNRSRMQEIGILKAIGYSSQDIRKILLVNGFRYSLIMFILAEIIDAAILFFLLRTMLLYPGQFLLSTLLANLILAFGVILIASLLPIRRLNKLDPVNIIERG
ncbi:ATP-binding cassette domain-containing protein [Lacticaseibacillus brantae]|nr:ATP-binding cassette domain-containing protein [Lacticaseibacillus brantae]